MSSARRLSVVLTVAVAVLSGPLLADYCADACEHAGTNSGGPATPACHHTESPSSRIGSPSAPCGGEHQATLVATPTTGPTTRAVMHELAVLPGTAVVDAAVIRDASLPASKLPPDRPSHAAPSPLRI